MTTPPSTKRPKFIVDVATEDIEGCDLPAEWTIELTPPRRLATNQKLLMCATCSAVWHVGMLPFWVVRGHDEPQYACDPCFNTEQWDGAREEMGWPPREPGVPYAETMARHDAELSVTSNSGPH